MLKYLLYEEPAMMGGWLNIKLTKINVIVSSFFNCQLFLHVIACLFVQGTWVPWHSLRHPAGPWAQG